MEHRLELEQLLLAGLPDNERKATVQSIRQVTAEKLAHIRSQHEQLPERVSAD